MALREDVLESIEMMQENIRETLRETSLLRRLALEAEVLIGAENIDKTCNNALRHAKRIRNFVSDSRNYRKKGR